MPAISYLVTLLEDSSHFWLSLVNFAAFLLAFIPKTPIMHKVRACARGVRAGARPAVLAACPPDPASVGQVRLFWFYGQKFADKEQ